VIEALGPEQIEAFERDGFLIVEELLSDRALERFRERYLPPFVRRSRGTALRAPR
jgi:hypothetical protein